MSATNAGGSTSALAPVAPSLTPAPSASASIGTVGTSGTVLAALNVPGVHSSPQGHIADLAELTSAAGNSLERVLRTVKPQDPDLAQRLAAGFVDVSKAITTLTKSKSPESRAQQLASVYQAMIILAVWVNSASALGCVSAVEATDCKVKLDVLSRSLNAPPPQW